MLLTFDMKHPVAPVKMDVQSIVPIARRHFAKMYNADIQRQMTSIWLARNVVRLIVFLRTVFYNLF